MRTYLTFIFFVATLIFFVVIPTYSFQYSDYELLVKGMRGDGKVLFFGNSVIRHSSKCDADSRSIAEMFADLTHEQVVDMSRGGMRIGRMLDILEILTTLGIKPKAVYIQISLDGDFIKQVNESSGIHSFFDSNLLQINHKFNIASKIQSDVTKRLEFNGKYYGDYGEFSKKHFVPEKQRMSCPEDMGFDKNFIAFMYWRNFLDKILYLKTVNETDRLKKLADRQINIVFWISPVNMNDIKKLHGSSSGEDVVIYKNTIIDWMNNFNIIDLSLGLPSESFADRWCACGHLNDQGRLHVASELVSKIGDFNEQ